MEVDLAWVGSIDGTLYAGATDGGAYASAEHLARERGDAMRLRAEGLRVLLRRQPWADWASRDGLLLSKQGGRGGALQTTDGWEITAAAVLDDTNFVATKTHGVQRGLRDKWASMNEGLPTADIRDMVRLGSTLYVAAAGFGVFRGAKPNDDNVDKGSTRRARDTLLGAR
jgi:hypothetical protein